MSVSMSICLVAYKVCRSGTVWESEEFKKQKKRVNGNANFPFLAIETHTDNDDFHETPYT